MENRDNEDLQSPTTPAAEAKQAGAPAPQAPVSAEAAQAEASSETNSDTPINGAIMPARDATQATWQERLVAERDELQERIQRLGAFLKKPAPMSPTDLSLLYDQRRVMERYLDILNVRVQRAQVSA